MKDMKDKDLIQEFPVDTILPMAAIYLLTQFASDVSFDEDYLQHDFSIQHFGLLSEKQAKLLKKID